MSWRAFDAVKEGCHQRPAAKLVQSYIAHELWDRRGGTADITNAALQRWTHYGERYLRRIVGELVAAGELVVWYRPGRKEGNRYAIPLYPRELGYEPPQTCENADGHTCNGCHSRYIVDREQLERDSGDYREKRNIERANREQNEAATDKPQRSTQRTQRPAGRRDQRQPDQPDAIPVPGADVAPAPAGLVGATPRGGDARAGTGTAPGPDAVVWLDPDEQRRRERANLAALGLTDADAEEYRANPRDWRAAHGIHPKPRTGAGHTRPAAQPGRSPSRR